MSRVTVYGPSLSTYVRTARMACEEKQVAYELKEIAFGSPEHAAVHPFGKVPALSHGDFRLFETIAIARYLDRVMPGPKLWPEEAQAAALVDQWSSVASAYLYPSVISEVVLPRFGMRPLVEDSVKAAVPKIDAQLKVVNSALEKGPFFLGGQVTAADLFLTPILFYLKMVPEGQVLSGHPAVNRWYEAMASRPSFAATMPVLPT